MAAQTERYIALLRGVNVGGARKLAMAELRAFAAGLGLEAPRTLLQSGNLVFDAPAQETDALAARLAEAARARLGLDTVFVLWRARDWPAVLAQNPFPQVAEAAPSKLAVVFAAGEPRPAALEAARSAPRGPERVEPAARRLYVHYPEGQGRSKLSLAVLEKALGCAATARNWNTVTKLAAMA